MMEYEYEYEYDFENNNNYLNQKKHVMSNPSERYNDDSFCVFSFLNYTAAYGHHD